MRIGLIAMSAKPYHAGHHALVEMAAAENDLVKVFVSLSDRKRPGEMPLLGSDMRTVWADYIEPILPGNVEVVYGGDAPVRRVYTEIQEAERAGSADIYTVYSDPRDTANNYPEKYRVKNFPQMYAAGQVIFAAEDNPGAFTRGVGTPDVSGTKMRAALAGGDFETFQQGMPAGIDARGVFNVLRPKGMTEAMLRALIRSNL